ncbi:MAG TPA: hypothetical protein VII45_00820 [Solirubrobacterales bacterium]
MSILDDAIREHLELKRQHGADDSELKQLEDDAFGPAERPSGEQALPDTASEAPTEFMTQPGDGAEAAEEQGEPSRGAVPNIADLQEAPQQAPPPAEPDSAEEPAPLVDEDLPAEEEHPAMEHETVPEPPAEQVSPPEHSTEERHAIAEQPTELFDVEGEIAASESRSPSDEELVEEEMQEPRLAPVDPLAGLEEVDEDDISVEGRSQDAAVEADEDDDFFDEQRLSEELDQALEAPVSAPPEPAPLPDLDEEENEGDDDASGHFEEDSEEHTEEHALEPVEEDSEEHPVKYADEDSDEHEVEGSDKDEQPTGDVLGGTPDFLEEAPEDDQLWFEQKPPKDFDFDD